LKILIVCEGFGESAVGGIERFLYGMVRELSKRHAVSVLAARRLADWMRRPRSESMDLQVAYPVNLSIPLLPYSYYFFTSVRAKKIKGVCRYFKPDVVFANNAFNGLSASVACEGSTIPVVTHLHGYMTTEFENELESMHGFILKLTLSRIRKIHSMAVAKSDLVVALSRVHESFLRRAGARRTAVLPNAADTSAFKPSVPSRFSYHPAIGYCGRMLPIKGVPYLLQAMSLVAKRVPNARLFLVGNFPDPYWSLGRWRKMVYDLQLERNVCFAGPFPLAEMPSVYRSFDLYCQLDKSTLGTPMAILEAMASGVPVITYDFPERREFFSKCSLLIKAGDVQSIADGIVALLTDNHLRNEMVLRGLDVAHEFSFENQTSNMERILQSVERL